jgi:flagellar basal-body rod protein FlgC
MTIFGTLGTSGSGMRVYRMWLDAVSDNIANMNDVKPSGQSAFQARYVVAQDAGNQLGDGARVSGIELGDPNGRLVYQPDHPYADPDGLVRYPDVDLGEQMTQLLMAQRGYQANLAAFDRVREAYSQALTIGRSVS